MTKQIKMGILSIFSIALLFTACEKDSDEAKEYKIQLALDSGDNDKVIELLGDCSSFSGSAKNDCFLNLGAAYFGKAKFDIISLSKEISKIDDSLSDDDQSKEFKKIIFEKLDNKNLQKGINQYKNLLIDNNSSVCNPKSYDENLTAIQKQACVSINPLLLSDIIDDDDNNKSKSTTSVSIEQIIQFKDVLQNAVPELKSSELIAIMDGDDNLSSDVDANENNILDSIEATDYVLKIANGNLWNGDAGVSNSDMKTNVYINTKLANVNYYEITVSNATNTNVYHRLTQKIENSSTFTLLTTIPELSCDDNNTQISGDINGTTVLPCVKLKEDGNITSLNDSVVNILNNDSLLNSIALASESEDDATSDENKIKDFKNDICDIPEGTQASTTNKGLCEVDDNGKITITQDALIDYMSKDK